MKQKTMISKAMIKCLHTLYRQKGINADTKEAMLHRLTNGRTTSTSRLYAMQAERLYGYLSAGVAFTDDERELKRHRSGCLNALQRYGVDTTDWDAVNRFCAQPTIAGKEFYYLRIDELINLRRKMEIIISKEGGSI